ncbi:hypothetical protein TGRUB_270080 [Toxoplasma gondii RUB]|uniref:Uncharacterized protein n=2 Tax=Toxoplasma gondii TaxID=5811 RepID=A0A086LY51_TOXGO|nr:hypothetical protein TGRUB_270080 [Toxoplasma gondii RUB]KFH06004.1 hypothetical protein TGVAND_270080 [Toxoplasma gondii VAND]
MTARLRRCTCRVLDHLKRTPTPEKSCRCVAGERRTEKGAVTHRDNKRSTEQSGGTATQQDQEQWPASLFSSSVST